MRGWRKVGVAIGIVSVLAIGVAAVGLDAAPTSARPARPGAPDALAVNDMHPALGVDPDDVSFSWHVVDARPGAVQRGYRIVVSRAPTTDPHSAAVVWFSDRKGSARQAFVPYQGARLAADTRYWWTVSTRDAAGTAGPFARPRSFITALRDGDWRAQWLRPGPANPGPEEYSYLRTDVRLGASPIVRATAYIGAAHQYRLSVNGRDAGGGPSFSYPDEQYFTTTDVTHLLHAGARNAIGVLHHWYGPGQGRPLSSPGLIVQISVLHRDGRHELITSNGTWREHAAEWLPAPLRNDEGDHIERIDARLAPIGWSRPGFDDRAWTPATVIGPAGTAPFTHLFAQRTRIVEHVVRPRSVHTLANGNVVVDYGATIAARPTVLFRHGVAGRMIAMHVGNALDADGSVSTTHATQDTNQSYSYVQRAGPQRFVPYTYLGFRYLEVDAPGEPLGAVQVVALARNSDLPPPAHFDSSRPILDAVFRMLEHTAQGVSQEQFVDTPTREKGQFLADSFDDAQAVMAAFGDRNLTWQALRDFARSQARYWPDGEMNAVYPNGDGKRTFLDFTERYPEWVWRYYLATGDRTTLARFSPVVLRVAGFLWHETDPATGLLTPPPDGTDESYGLIDWPPLMRYGYDTRTRIRTTSAILAADAFARAAQIAQLLGDHHDARTWRTRYNTTAHAINRRLRRSDGVYIDGIAVDGTVSTHASQQANTFALAYGVVPAADRVAVARYVASLGISSGPMDGLELLRALHDGRRDADVLRILTDTTDPGWAYIVANGGTFSWESWKPLDVEGDSMSHGWGSSALVAFHEALLGVTLTRPPDDHAGPRILLTPPPAALRSVGGEVPTTAGAIVVRWTTQGSHRVLSITIPPNASARLRLAGRRDRTIPSGRHVIDVVP